MGEFAYFKKRHPEVPLYTKRFGPIKGFTDIIGDFAFVRTNNENLKEAFRDAIKDGVGGVSEITSDQYEKEFTEKKHLSSPNPKPKDRESIGAPYQDGLVNRAAEKPKAPAIEENPPQPPQARKQASMSSVPLPEDKKPTASKMPAPKKP